MFLSEMTSLAGTKMTMLTQKKKKKKDMGRDYWGIAACLKSYQESHATASFLF